MKKRVGIILTGLAAASFCVTPVWAQTASQGNLTHFLNKISKVNNEQRALAKEAAMKASSDMSVKTYANTVNWDDKANQEAVNALAMEHGVRLKSETPALKSGLKNSTGKQFAKNYINTEVTDQTKALDAYKAAEKSFANDPKVETYIKESIPMVESHVVTARLLQRKMMGQRQTASSK